MAFMESGIIAVDLSKMQFEERLLYVRSEPINLFARTHDVKRTAFIPNLDTSILLVDTNTGISFYPLKIDNAKILGDGELHFPVDQLRLPIWNYGRSRFRKFPYYLVKTAQELSDVIQTFVKVGSEHFSVLFRGQTKDYQTKRHTVVNCLLYGEDSVLEPNLPSNASRNGYDYFGVESYVRMLLLDINYQITGEKSTLWNVEDEDEFINLIAPEVDAKKKINSSMAIAQHYGIPTYGLDVTSSWEIAWWFATHQHRNINGKVEISNLDWSSKLIDDWPIIYIIRTPNSINLQTINSSALRPIAQSAFLCQVAGALTPILARKM